MTDQPFDLAGVIAAGEEFADALPPGSVVWLTGPLGAGKTTLVSALVRRRTGRPQATSPTFALVHHYDGPHGAIYHVDCYRLRRPEDAIDLDWQTMVSSDLLLIEWPDHAGPWAPPPTVTIALEVVDATHRRITVR